MSAIFSSGAARISVPGGNILGGRPGGGPGGGAEPRGGRKIFENLQKKFLKKIKINAQF